MDKTTRAADARAAFLASLAGREFAMDEAALSAAICSVEAMTPEQIGALLFTDDDAAPSTFDKVGDNALISISGPIVNKADGFDRLMGRVSTQDIISQIVAADADASIERIMLLVDSPGGMVDGLNAAANAIKAARKPVEAHVEGVAASAAYWLASAADKITAEPTARIGSIGAISTLRERSREGVFTFTSSQSPLKNASLETSAGRAVYQQMVDDLADVFISAVAENRNTTRANVLENYGRGAIMVASRALQAGLIDQITGVSPKMEEQLKALTAQIEALEAREIEFKAQIVELSAKADDRDEAEAKAVAAEEARVELAAQLAEAQKMAEESATALAAAQAAQAEAEAKEAALKREQAINGAAPKGKALTAEQRAHLEMAYDLQMETGKPMFDSAVAQLVASGAGVDLAEKGHGEEVNLSADTDSNTEKAKALAAEEGIPFMVAYTRILNQEA